jgi:hypothetical protein
MADLFSIALLQAVATSAAGWATKKFLDTITTCPSCGSTHERAIANGASNPLACTACTNKLDQYSIATTTTVRNGRLMGANIFNPHWEQEDQRGWFVSRHIRNWFLLDLCSVGMQHHGMVMKASFRDVRTNKVWPAAEQYFNNEYDRMTIPRRGWYFDPYTFPHGSAIVADVKVETLEGDVLHSIAPLVNFT